MEEENKYFHSHKDPFALASYDAKEEKDTCQNKKKGERNKLPFPCQLIFQSTPTPSVPNSKKKQIPFSHSFYSNKKKGETNITGDLQFLPPFTQFLPLSYPVSSPHSVTEIPVPLPRTAEVRKKVGKTRNNPKA